MYSSKKEYDRAITDFKEAIRLDAKDARGYNGLACLLATCPDEKYRDGLKAVASAKVACELSEWKNAAFLDTLAAAYAEAGQFEEAVRYQIRVIEDTAFQKDDGARKRLDLYKKKMSYREH
jgi:Flp pilus assembly protein TadD